MNEPTSGPLEAPPSPEPPQPHGADPLAPDSAPAGAPAAPERIEPGAAPAARTDAPPSNARAADDPVPPTTPDAEGPQIAHEGAPAASDASLPPAADDSGEAGPGAPGSVAGVPEAAPAGGSSAGPPAPPDPETAAVTASPRPPDADTTAPPPKIGVDLRFIDFAGRPIPDLQHKITWMEDGKRQEFPGKTDARGRGVEISSMKMHTRFELWVRKDDGSYVVKHQATVDCENLSLCVVSPHIRIDVGTELHAGSPGTLPAKPAAQDQGVERRPNAPIGRSNAGAVPDATLQPGRDAQGHPVATSTVPSQDANDRHRLPTFALWAWKSFIDRFLAFTTPAKVPAAAAAGAAKSAAPAPVSPTPAPAPAPAPANRGAVPTKPPEGPPRKSESPAAPALPNVQREGMQARALSKADLERVQKLIECMEEQARWDWAELKQTYRTSAGIKSAISNGTFNFSAAQKDEKRFTGNCYMSVKVGLWRAGYVEGVDGGGVSPSTHAKAWLEAQGFKDVTSSLPDARWAEPGDVIVYEYDETTIKRNNEKIKDALALYEKEKKEYPEKKNLYEKERADWKGRQSVKLSTLHEERKGRKDSKDPEPKPPKPPEQPQGENYGHIDVRTYDGYISDAKVLKLPTPIFRPANRKGMVVNGVFRKLSDPLAGMRVRAFLKCIREWECHEEKDDQKRYYLMYTAINGSRRFSGVEMHPHKLSGEKNFTAAGAYQITVPTYNTLFIPEHGVGGEFSPEKQDRLAVVYLQILPLNPLAMIRSGKISDAADAIRKIWSSMPSGEHPRREKRNNSIHIFSMNDLVERHEAIMREMKE